MNQRLIKKQGRVVGIVDDDGLTKSPLATMLLPVTERLERLIDQLEAAEKQGSNRSIEFFGELVADELGNLNRRAYRGRLLVFFLRVIERPERADEATEWLRSHAYEKFNAKQNVSREKELGRFFESIRVFPPEDLFECPANMNVRRIRQQFRK